MNKFFQILLVIFAVVTTQGCMTYYSHYEGFEVRDNFQPGSSNWQSLPPSHTTTYHVGASTGGRVERYDDGPRHYHHNNYHPQKVVVVQERVETRTTSVYVTPAPRVGGLLPDGEGRHGGHGQYR